MAIIHRKPTSAGSRQRSTVHYRAVLTASEPVKSLTRGFRRGSGRNRAGRITTRHKGGGEKRLFRNVDFLYDKRDIVATIRTVEYDPNRSSFIASVVYRDGTWRYVAVPKSLKVGDTFVVSETAEVKTGNRLPLRKIAVGTQVYHVELRPGGGAKMARSAGVFAEVLSNDAGVTSLRLPSGEVRKVSDMCWASVGALSNEEHNLVSIGKAGHSRHMGIRPTVRGSAMNPVDHPYGGGEGRQGRGTRRPKTRWGKTTGGHKTRHPKKYSNVHIITRRPKKLRKR